MRILVCEPQAEVRELLRHVVERLGHDPVFPEKLAEAEDVDLVLLEPADLDALATVRSLLRGHPGLPVVCASIHPDSGEIVGLRPLAYLVKPFGLSELERALTAAVAAVTAPGRAA